MDQPAEDNRKQGYYNSEDKPRGSTDRLPSLTPPGEAQEQDIVFASNGFAVEELSPLPTAPTAEERPISGKKAKTPSALAPTVDAIQVSPTPQKSTTRRNFASRTRKLSLGPSNFMLAVLWTIATVSVGWAIYFYLTQP